ncbi:V-set and transmembrane domain-containing protein 2A [Gadus macrocephalus]|uniref:V-set and transmembrane domain-containing protein 2A n=1 Tax=Gadus macrocephalus TaxID=80720 RepID=UPI0028CB2455|nr:V-set and transmembrane domain-containing protein 2A [Gadus macrocephalus]
MMWNSHDSVGFAVLAGLCFQMGFSFEGQFTDFPSNTTALEGQNIEMACAFQSGTASVYLEIQWWFFREPVPSDSSEDVHAEELETPVEVDPDMDGNKISTVKVQGNDISHKLQISRVSKNDEGLYECRVTLANYGELLEHKAQAWLKVNSTLLRPQRPTLPVKKSSPLHLTDKKPRKPSSPLGPDTMSGGDQMAGSTSSSREPSKSAKDIPSSGTRTSSGGGPTLLLLLLLGCGLAREALLPFRGLP